MTSVWWPQSCSKDPYLLAGTQTLPKMVSNLAAVKITGSCPACAGVNGELTVSPHFSLKLGLNASGHGC